MPAMTKLTYAEQLAHPKWQRRRLEMLNAAGWACTTCGNEDKQLHVHHRVYIKGRQVWDYSDHELVVLCHVCHGTEHEAKDLLDQLLLAVPQSDAPIRTALSLLNGYFDAGPDRVFDMMLKVQSSGLAATNVSVAGCIAAMLADLPLKRYSEVSEFINTLRAQEGLDER